MSPRTPQVLDGLSYRLLSGAGNLFVVLDGRVVRSGAPMADWARAVCSLDYGWSVQGQPVRPDGLMVVVPNHQQSKRKTQSCTMRIWNADGSEPETCGNGLRCAAKYAYEAGIVSHTACVVYDAAGQHDCELELDSTGTAVVAARISMGRPLLESLTTVLRSHDDLVQGAAVNVGNPHFVLQVSSVATAPVTTLGPRLERHAAFPQGANIEFLAMRDAHHAELRVWERGCGETQACGSGTVAAAVAAEALGRARLPLRVSLPGGVLTVSRRFDGVIELHGPVCELT